MSIFGRRKAAPDVPPPPDPKDELIAALRDEVLYLRVKVDSLQGQLLALHSAAAYRTVFGSTDGPPVAPGSPLTSQVPTVFRLRTEVYEPKFTLRKKEAEARSEGGSKEGES